MLSDTTVVNHLPHLFVDMSLIYMLHSNSKAFKIDVVHFINHPHCLTLENTHTHTHTILYTWRDPDRKRYVEREEENIEVFNCMIVHF